MVRTCISISICPLPRPRPPFRLLLTWPRFARPPSLDGWKEGRREGGRAMMISHFINQILFSFLDGAAIPFPPFHTWRQRLTLSSHVGPLLLREGTRGTTFARMGTYPTSSRPDSPQDFVPNFPLRRPLRCNVSGRSPSCLGMGK